MREEPSDKNLLHKYKHKESSTTVTNAIIFQTFTERRSKACTCAWQQAKNVFLWLEKSNAGLFEFNCSSNVVSSHATRAHFNRI